MRIFPISRGLPSAQHDGSLTRAAGLRTAVLVASLAAASGAAFAGPAVSHQPALRPVDDHGLLDAVADRGNQLLSSGNQIVSNMRDGAANLVDSALGALGVRYRRGGNSFETGFDCSGFTRYVFENSIGKVLPHRADEQANSPDLVKVEQKDLKPGDLVFFNTLRRTFSHVGIYLGGGKFIHAPRTGESVRIEDMNISYWTRHFTGARRVPELASAGGTGTDPSQSLAALAAKLTTPGSSLAGGRDGLPSVLTPVGTPLLTASLNPSGLKSGSTLPSLPDRATSGFVPMNRPFARPMDR